MVFDAHEPIGGRRGDLQAAQIVGLLAEVYRDRKQRAEPFKLNEFMPEFWVDLTDNKSERTLEEWRALIVMLNTAFGGIDERKK